MDSCPHFLTKELIILFVMTNSLHKAICTYISKKWISRYKTQRQFAIEHNIDEKTVRRIRVDANYTMELNTLHKICESRKITLSDFFKLIDK